MRQLVYNVFYIWYQPALYLLGIQTFLKCCEVPRYYVHDCSFYRFFTSIDKISKFGERLNTRLIPCCLEIFVHQIFFCHIWHGTPLLVIKLVYTKWLRSCRSTLILRLFINIYLCKCKSICLIPYTILNTKLIYICFAIPISPKLLYCFSCMSFFVQFSINTILFPSKSISTVIQNYCNLIFNLGLFFSWYLQIITECLPTILVFNFFYDGDRYHIETSPLILQSKSMDWFLYDKGLRHERVNNW